MPKTVSVPKFSCGSSFPARATKLTTTIQVFLGPEKYAYKTKRAATGEKH